MYLSPLPNPLLASTTKIIASTSLVTELACLFKTLPSLFIGLAIPGVSTNIICVSISL